MSYKWILLCFRWLYLIPNITLQKRRQALYPLVATHTWIASSCLPRILGLVLRIGILPHHTVTKRESKVLVRRTGEGRSLVSAPLLPSLPPRLFLPPHELPLFVCSKEHRGIKLRRGYQFLLLCLTEDAVYRSQAGAWGKIQFSFKILLHRE